MMKAIYPALLLVLVTSAPASALMRKVSIEEVTAHSSQIVLGTVIEKHAEWTPTRSIVTTVKVQVEERIMGSSGESYVTISVPGGEVGEIGLMVSDMPQFEIGQRALIYLNRSFRPGQHCVAAAFQGKYTLEGGRVLETGAAEHEFVEEVRVAARNEMERRK
ncbi:MAG: hypothetical protein AB1714_09535 [Acidobacteriota bacterium]